VARSNSGGARRGDAGVTLVELSVATFVGALLLTAVAGVFVGGTKALRAVNATTAATADARHAGEEVSRMLRVAYPPTASQPAIVAATPTGVTFWALVDHSGTVGPAAPAPVLIQYSFSGNCLTEKRTVSGVAGTPTCVIRTTRAPSFTYYPLGGVQSDGSLPAPLPATPAVAPEDLGRIQGVEIALSVQDPHDPTAHAVSVQNRVTLENVVAAASAAAREG
jgi:type II secretory pathway pseudopilin PulG